MDDTKTPRKFWRFMVALLPLCFCVLALSHAYDATWTLGQGCLASAATLDIALQEPPAIYDCIRLPHIFWKATLAEKYAGLATWYTLGLRAYHESSMFMHVIGSLACLAQVF